MKFKTWADFNYLAIETTSFEEMQDVLELLYPFVIKYNKQTFHTSTMEEYVEQFLTEHKYSESWPNYIKWENNGFYQNDEVSSFIGDYTIISFQEFIESIPPAIDLAAIY